MTNRSYHNHHTSKIQHLSSAGSWCHHEWLAQHLQQNVDHEPPIRQPDQRYGGFGEPRGDSKSLVNFAGIFRMKQSSKPHLLDGWFNIDNNPVNKQEANDKNIRNPSQSCHLSVYMYIHIIATCNGYFPKKPTFSCVFVEVSFVSGHQKIRDIPWAAMGARLILIPSRENYVSHRSREVRKINIFKKCFGMGFPWSETQDTNARKCFRVKIHAKIDSSLPGRAMTSHD